MRGKRGDRLWTVYTAKQTKKKKSSLNLSNFTEVIDPLPGSLARHWPRKIDRTCGTEEGPSCPGQRDSRLGVEENMGLRYGRGGGE